MRGKFFPFILIPLTFISATLLLHWVRSPFIL